MLYEGKQTKLNKIATKARNFYHTIKELKLDDTRAFKEMMRMGKEKFGQILQPIWEWILLRDFLDILDSFFFILITFIKRIPETWSRFNITNQSFNIEIFSKYVKSCYAVYNYSSTTWVIGALWLARYPGSFISAAQHCWRTVKLFNICYSNMFVGHNVWWKTNVIQHLIQQK